MSFESTPKVNSCVRIMTKSMVSTPIRRQLVLATQNSGKLAEISEYFQDLPWELVLMSEDLAIEETGNTLLENARIKASEVARITHSWAIADDSGLEVNALDGAPGLYSARYAPTNQERIQRVLRELAPHRDRSAQFRSAVAIARPDGSIALEAEGICPGEILQEPQGNGGFGYDPIFYLPSVGKTFAEMSTVEKRTHSHRGLALAALQPRLTLI
jgi:XTP/dITP diphosphohydrolase